MQVFTIISVSTGLALFAWFVAIVADIADSVEKIYKQMIGRRW